METKDLRNNIQLYHRSNSSGNKDDIMSYTYYISIDAIDDVPKPRDISENNISFAFENYTENSDVRLYKNTYRPDSDKFKIDPRKSKINWSDLYISKNSPDTISTWSDIEFTIVVENYSRIDNNITIIPYIDGISVNRKNKNTSKIPPH